MTTQPTNESMETAKKIIFHLTQKFSEREKWPEPDINFWDRLIDEVLDPLQVSVATALDAKQLEIDGLKDNLNKVTEALNRANGAEIMATIKVEKLMEVLTLIKQHTKWRKTQNEMDVNDLANAAIQREGGA